MDNHVFNLFTTVFTYYPVCGLGLEIRLTVFSLIFSGLLFYSYELFRFFPFYLSAQISNAYHQSSIPGFRTSTLKIKICA